MNKMSKDRVHFTIRDHHLEKPEIRDCLMEVFGLTQKDFPRASNHYLAGYKDLHLVCRPSQFARFVILRHVKYGQPNNMSCLNMKLVVPPEAETCIDVSENPNRIDRSVGQ